MYNIEIDNTINQITGLYYRFRFWKINDASNLWETGRKLILLIGLVSYFISFEVGAYLNEDINESIFSAVLGVANGVNAFRMYNIIWKKKQILKALKDIATDSTNDHEEFVRANSKLKKISKLAQYFMLMLLTANIVVALFPAFSSDRNLAFNIAFPLDSKHNLVALCITQTYVVVQTTYSTISFLQSIIIWYLLLNCSIKYDMLGKQLKMIGSQRMAVSESENEKLFLYDIITAVRRHRKINEMVHQLSSMFGTLFFLQVATSGSCICGAIYTLIFNSEQAMFQKVICCICMIYDLFDIFMLMYLGNEIKLSSSQLLYCLFESNWIEQSQSCKKYFIFFSEVLKQPQVMLIGKLYAMNMETFSSILNGAYSMFNLLKSVK